MKPGIARGMFVPVGRGAGHTPLPGRKDRTEDNPQQLSEDKFGHSKERKERPSWPGLPIYI